LWEFFHPTNWLKLVIAFIEILERKNKNTYRKFIAYMNSAIKEDESLARTPILSVIRGFRNV